MKLKKFICVLLSILAILPTFVITAGAKEAEDENVKKEGEFSYVVQKNMAILVGYTGYGGDVVIPESLGGLPLVAIRKNVFIENNSIITVHLPASVEDISDEQFCLCDRLKAVTVAEGNKTYTSVDGVLYQDGGKTLRFHPAANSTEYDIPEGVTKIAPYAFFTNKELAAVTFPSTLTEIGANAFYDCQVLREVYLPDSVVKVGESAFSWCINLKELKVPDKLSDMGRRAFFPCYIVTHSDEEFVTLGDDVLVAYLGNSINIRIPEGVKKISDVFFVNEEIESVTIPESVKEVSDYAFYGCIRLKEVKLPKGLKKIGEWAFFGCEKLKSIDIPSGTALDVYSFGGCVKLESVSVNTKTIPAYAFARCDRLEKVTLGSKVKEIEDYAFYFCESLKSLKLPAKLESIGPHALRRIGVEKLTLGASLTQIGRSAFLENPNLVLTVTDGSYAHKYAKDNKLDIKVKQPTKKDVEIMKEQKDPTFIELLLNDYLIWVIVGGSVILLLLILFIVLIIVKKKKRRKAKADLEKAEAEKLSAAAEKVTEDTEETTFDVIEE